MTTATTTIRSTCRWKFSGARPDDSSSRYGEPCIHCLWHENIPTYMAYYFPLPAKPRHIWLQHPSMYMMPIHVLIRWNNCDVVLGSSGHGGKEALTKLVRQIKEFNGATSIFPDGPEGPKCVLKPGVIDIAQATGLPIIPIRFKIESSFRHGWDQKHWPVPFSMIEVQEQSPLHVTEANREEVFRILPGLL